MISDDEIRVNDAKCKEKGKEYFDRKFHVEEGMINESDIVVLQQNRENKLSSHFGCNPYKVVEKKVNSVQIEGIDGVQKRRSVIHMKKINFENNESKNSFWNQSKITLV